MQLRHYFFIGTLNPMLQYLTRGEPSLGKHAQHTTSCLKVLANMTSQRWPDWSNIRWAWSYCRGNDINNISFAEKEDFWLPLWSVLVGVFFFLLPTSPCLCVATVSQYINAFAVTQLCGVLCAPWNGLIMDRHKGKLRAAGNKGNNDKQWWTQQAYLLSLSIFLSFDSLKKANVWMDGWTCIVKFV